MTSDDLYLGLNAKHISRMFLKTLLESFECFPDLSGPKHLGFRVGHFAILPVTVTRITQTLP